MNYLDMTNSVSPGSYYSSDIACDIVPQGMKHVVNETLSMISDMGDTSDIHQCWPQYLV